MGDVDCRSALEDSVKAVSEFGFKDRQARFLVTVMRYAGVCVPRQFATFAGIAYGHKTGVFFHRLVARRYASPCGCVHNRARVYHVHHKGLYRAVGETDSPLRRPMPVPRVIERLMVLDVVIDHHEIPWLATAGEKVAHMAALTRVAPEELPRLTSRTKSTKTVRLFPDRLPIGLHPEGRAILVFPAVGPTPQEFRVFLQRHAGLLRRLPAWTVLAVLPPHLAGMDRACLQVAQQELGLPLRPATFDELNWYFERRRASTLGALDPVDEERYQTARRAFRTPRFDALYRAWLREGDTVLESVRVSTLANAIASGAAKGRVSRPAAVLSPSPPRT